MRTRNKREQFQDPRNTEMELREALTGIYTGIYTSPLMTDQIPEVWKVLHRIILNRAMR